MNPTGFDNNDQKSKRMLKIEALLKKAEQEYRNGFFIEAEKKYFEILQSCFNDKIALNLAGVAAHVWLQLGNIYLQKKDLEKAINAYRNSIQADPVSSRAYNGLGIAFEENENHKKAIASYRKAIELTPNYAEAYYNLGNSLSKINQKTEAVKCYRKSLSIDPSRAETLLNLGNIYYRMEKYQEAIACYRQALEKWPNSVGVHTNLGLAYFEAKNMEEALKHFKQALELQPDSESVLKYSGIAAAGQGKDKEAEAYFKNLIEKHPKFEYEIMAAMVAPTIFDSTEMITVFRQNFKEKLIHLQSKNKNLEDPYKQVGLVNFIFGMHGQKEKEIREQIAGFYLKVAPQLAWTSPSLKTGLSKQKIRIGFVSMFLHKHTIGNLYHGLIENLSKDRFHVSVLRFDRKDDSIARKIDQSVEEVIHLPKNIYKARKIVAAQNLDILFYPELGMEPVTYFLSFARMAPVQCKRGFQITMGIPNIDYFLSSKWAEPADAQDHYSEKLVLLERTGYYYQRPNLPDPIPSRKELGLPEDKRIYACPQSLFKLHPDFDVVLGNILRSDPKGILVLLRDKNLHLERLLLKRFQRNNPGMIDRLCFVNRMEREKFLSLFVVADAVLDPIFISGGNTSLECFAFGIPVITWPSKYLPGRLTYGFYKQMNIMDCVADDLEHYVELAVRLANDKAWYGKIKRKIENKSDMFFEDQLAVREIESFFEWAVQRAYT